MTVPIRYIYDVFVSYSSDDRNWVHDVLLPRLKKAGLKICIADRDFELGVPHIVNIEQAVEQSRKILPIMTLGWLKNKWSQLDLLLAQTDDPAGYLPK
ncbi:MAG: TIR domain-containing protein, partial [Roseiflexaceae bacterium]